MYTKMTAEYNGKSHTFHEFDPSSSSGKKWLEKMAAKMAATGTRCQHISNNAPRDISEPDAAKRKAGVEVAKKWLDGAAILGAQSMRVNSGRSTNCAGRGGDHGLPRTKSSRAT